MTQPERERREAEGQDTPTEPSAHIAGQAGGLGRKAREAAAAEHTTARRAAAPLVLAASVAIAVVGWISRRRRKQRGILRRLTKKR